ncbi:MAG TPA: acetyl-CoA carboxylase biotin carboxylase subunit [Candidatus Acidoferrales bacterium]|nr:acetyl-CoA carboxylase biotin carboxylase subunit [Candidatus Acidoferrales bacterium]
MSISRVLVANRGEIAVRVIKACQALRLQSVLAVSEADRKSMAAQMADRVVCIGPARAAESYLKIEALVSAALGTGADALHPGYGFLAEEPKLAEACAEHGIRFIGPSAESIRLMGNKLEARALAAKNGIPIAAGSMKVHNLEEALRTAREIGFPLLFKAAAGGGGRGIKIVSSEAGLAEAFSTAGAEARAAFGDDTLYMERYIANARHIEVQVFGDRFGNVIHFGERDCSLQRRHQKIVEEAPAPNLPDQRRRQIHLAAVALAKKIGYENAGTVEFIFDRDSGGFYFLEMNTRIQVEHPVTEMITGVDLVQEQIRVAGGEPLSVSQSDVRFTGHAIECRINAESPQHGFRPSPGLLSRWEPPTGEGVRLDSHCFAGYVIPPFYDSLMGKLITHGPTRAEALSRMREALASFVFDGVETNIPFLRAVIDHPDYVNADVNTTWLERNLATLSAPAG